MNNLSEKSSCKAIQSLLIDSAISFIDFLLYVVIRKSLELADTYERMSRSMEYEKLQVFFNEMAHVKHDEVSSYQTTYGPLSGIFSEGEEHIIHSALPEDKIDEPIINDIEEACHFALKIEIEHFRFFARLAQLEKEARAKELFLSVLQMHKTSLKFLETRLEACRGCSNTWINGFPLL